MRTCLGLSAVLVLGLASAGRCDCDPEAKIHAIIDKAVKAMGGTEKVARLRVSSWKGKAEHRRGDRVFDLVHEGSWRAWDSYRVQVEIRSGGRSRKLLTVLHGDKGWERENDREAIDLRKDHLAFWKDGLYMVRAFQLLPGLKDRAFQTSHLGEVRIGDRPAVGIRVVHKGHKDLNLFFDKETGLPLKSEARLVVPDG